MFKTWYIFVPLLNKVFFLHDADLIKAQVAMSCTQRLSGLHCCTSAACVDFSSECACQVDLPFEPNTWIYFPGTSGWLPAAIQKQQQAKLVVTKKVSSTFSVG